MRSYGQYCPIARASEILAERWTPIILRDILNGVDTFTKLAEGAPGMSRTLLSSRLRQLAGAGVIEISPNPGGRGNRYTPTEAGLDLSEVMAALGVWGERWIELAPEHLDPGVLLEAWVRQYVADDLLPDHLVVVRFDFPGVAVKGNQLWVLFRRGDSEVCRTHPGYEEDLVVTAEPRALAEWHLGRIRWTDALAAESIQVAGATALARRLPSWNLKSGFAHLEIERRGAASS